MTRKDAAQRDWTRKEEMLVCHMREAGAGIAEIAAATGRTYAAVSARLSALGATKKIGRPRRKRGELEAAVRELAKGRRSDAEIGRLLDVQHQEVYRCRKRLGIKSGVSHREAGRRGGVAGGRGRPKGGAAGRGQGGKHGHARGAPLTAAQAALAADHFGAVAKAAGKWARAWPGDPDELASAAGEGLVMAARTFDPAGGVAFATHAFRRIDGAIADALRARRPLGYRRDHDDPPGTVPLGDYL